jgi:sugar phosphate isomerase/epimerase
MRLGIGSWTFPWAIGVPGYPQPKQPLNALDLLEMAKELDVDIVQICDNYALHERDASELTAIREAAGEMGILVEVGTRGVETAHLLRYLEIAGILGSSSVRTIIDDPDAPYLDWIKRAIPEYEATGVAIALENNERLSPESFAELMRAVDNPYLGMTLDTVNTLGRLARIEEVVETLAPYAINLHYKDYDIVRVDHRMGFSVIGRPAGEGRVDSAWLFGQFAQAGRDPDVILELWPPFLATIEETIANEAEWAIRSIRFLKTVMD